MPRPSSVTSDEGRALTQWVGDAWLCTPPGQGPALPLDPRRRWGSLSTAPASPGPCGGPPRKGVWQGLQTQTLDQAPTGSGAAVPLLPLALGLVTCVLSIVPLRVALATGCLGLVGGLAGFGGWGGQATPVAADGGGQRWARGLWRRGLAFESGWGKAARSVGCVGGPWLVGWDLAPGRGWCQCMREI